MNGQLKSSDCFTLIGLPIITIHQVMSFLLERTEFTETWTHFERHAIATKDSQDVRNTLHLCLREESDELSNLRGLSTSSEI